MEASQLAMYATMRELYESGAYSDLTVICGPKRFSVHKAIVCTKCPYFARACQEGRWKEGAENVISLEANDKSIEFEDVEKDDPQAVQHMFEFLYLHNYDVAITPHGENHLVLHARIYALGAKYDIPALKTAALERFQASARSHWRPNKFLEAVRTVFTTTADNDDALREAAASILLSHNSTLAVSTEMDDAVRTIDGLAYHLWRKSNATPKGPACKSCNNVFVKACIWCTGGKSKKASLNCYFVSCDCLPDQQYCLTHQNLLLGEAGSNDAHRGFPRSESEDSLFDRSLSVE